MNESTREVGVIGLGNMGGGMAATLVRAGWQVSGHDSSDAACARARAAGVRIVDDIATLCAQVDTLISVLPDSPQVETTLLGEAGVLHNAQPGSLVIECSTIEPAISDRCATALAAASVQFIDAAMGRSPLEAASGRLMFMVGADDDALARARPLLDCLGDELHHCGPVGSGIRTKLVLNLLSQSTCQLSAEVFALGLKMGIARDTLHAVLSGSLGANGFITRYWPVKVLVGDTTPGFAIRL
ncbi:MAG: NAD(P)-dependent oxidoreductase [Gammaproteobacteria bacterium]|nr:NAD(P)-dependent oxidoreductase [Gammaproteobacteria bacterium]